MADTTSIESSILAIFVGRLLRLGEEGEERSIDAALEEKPKQEYDCEARFRGRKGCDGGQRSR